VNVSGGGREVEHATLRVRVSVEAAVAPEEQAPRRVLDTSRHLHHVLQDILDVRTADLEALAAPAEQYVARARPIEPTFTYTAPTVNRRYRRGTMSPAC
jgi:hypothetical protein